MFIRNCLEVFKVPREKNFRETKINIWDAEVLEWGVVRRSSGRTEVSKEE